MAARRNGGGAGGGGGGRPVPGAGVQGASDSFFGFDTSLPPEESITFGDDGGLADRPREADADADLDNDETFGGDLGGGAAPPRRFVDAGGAHGRVLTIALAAWWAGSALAQPASSTTRRAPAPSPSPTP